MSLDINLVRNLSGFTDENAALLADMAAELQSQGPSVVKRALDHRDAYLEFSNSSKSRSQLKQGLEYWLKGMFSGTYDETYYQQRYALSRALITAKEVNLVGTLSNISYMRTVILSTLEDIYANAPDKSARLLAVDKVIDLDLVIMIHIVKEIEEERTDMFLKITGFTRELVESMVAAEEQVEG